MKTQKGAASIPQSHLHSRISYLYQAATYLAEVYKNDPASRKNESKINHVQDVEMKEKNDSTGREQFDAGTEETIKMTIGSHNRSQEAEVTKPSISAALGQSRRLLSHLRAVSLKSQIRLTPTMKHSICKKCDSLLAPGRTSTSRLENKSHGGRKPWADVLVVTCNSCGLAKRYPIGAKRQSRRAERNHKKIPGLDKINAVAEKG